VTAVVVVAAAAVVVVVGETVVVAAGVEGAAPIPIPAPGTGGAEGTSPGTVPGTEDDDRTWNDLGSNLTRVTLQALASYAASLQRVGALDAAFAETAIR
jgi:hypothetical protein